MADKRTILIADDELNIREGLSRFLEIEGYETLKAKDGKEAWEIVSQGNVDMVLTDIRMPELSGIDLLKKIYTTYPTIPVILITGHGTIEEAVQAMQNGAVNLLTKPVNLKTLSAIVKRTIINRDLEEKNIKLQQELERIKNTNGNTEILGKSQKYQNLMALIKQVAPTKASVLITGESGTGKELVAKTLVELSSRKDKSFEKVHLMSYNSNLIEDVLFGHVKGAFTGATSDRPGLFELAHEGTLFLDEIGELDLLAQVKLLRVLQEGEIQRVGENKTRKVDVRVIAATNRDLKKEVEEGRFREDLYYRLNVISIEVPPLRERKDDILLLATEFLNRHGKENNKKVSSISSEAKAILTNYSWPGNIRELNNCIERAVIMSKNDVIEPVDLPAEISKVKKTDSIEIPIGTTFAEAEKQIILETINYCKGNKSRAADILGLGRKTIQRKTLEYEGNSAN
ncbi:MAG: sigma-54-dependent Fis family transcriptional regulator [Sphaerochaetaceae bacterium]|nr:sigma-54-dependent Fis family transcriptional regulator [Sphaerochaetaceae bacterium]